MYFNTDNVRNELKQAVEQYRPAEVKAKFASFPMFLTDGVHLVDDTFIGVSRKGDHVSLYHLLHRKFDEIRLNQRRSQHINPGEIATDGLECVEYFIRTRIPDSDKQKEMLEAIAPPPKTEPKMTDDLKREFAFSFLAYRRAGVKKLFQFYSTAYFTDCRFTDSGPIQAFGKGSFKQVYERLCEIFKPAKGSSMQYDPLGQAINAMADFPLKIDDVPIQPLMLQAHRKPGRPTQTSPSPSREPNPLQHAGHPIQDARVLGRNEPEQIKGQNLRTAPLSNKSERAPCKRLARST